MSFDPITYFQTIQTQLKELTGDHRFFRVTGLSHMEEILTNLRKAVYPVMCVDDSQDGIVIEAGGGYYDSRYYSVFILSKVKIHDDADRNTKMATCRAIFFKILSRMVHESAEFGNGMVYLHPDMIKYDEVGYLADDLFGIHFGFTVETPQNLEYVSSDWSA